MMSDRQLKQDRGGGYEHGGSAYYGENGHEKGEGNETSWTLQLN